MNRRSLLLVVFSLFAFPLPADELAVGWISRTPELEYVWASTNPTVEGWPSVGQQVTWRAHVKTEVPAPRQVGYRWTIDGREAARGTVVLTAGGYTTVDLPWAWTFERHRIGFEIDTSNAITEESERNNALAVFSDGLAVGFWVEQSFYDFFRANQAKLGIGSTGVEDWLQRTVALFNDMSALAVYPETPKGVLDRWRIQKIVVVPDGSLPLNGLPDDFSPGAGPETHPDKDDQTVDLMWGFPASTVRNYTNLTSTVPTNAFYTSYYAMHELGHARYLVDIYAWDVLHRAPFYTINIQENGQPIVGTYFPGGVVHRSAEQGLMNAQYTFIDRYSAIALNFLSGRRATIGNYNEPRNFAEFLNDLPAQNRITIRDENGARLPNADVWIYWSVANSPAWYATQYDNVPDIKLRTDDKGQVLVGRSPFAANGKVVHTYSMTNGVAIVRAAKDGKVAYGFLESRLFNLAYWRGQTDFADHELVVGRRCDSRGPSLLAPAWDATAQGAATLRWAPLEGATRYRVYVSTNLSTPRLITITSGTDARAHLDGTVYWWVEAEVGVCGLRRSGVGRYEATATSNPRRRATRH
jgi:hypothetical protein